MKTQRIGDQNWIAAMIIFVIVLILTAFTYPKEVRMMPFVVGFPTLLLLVTLKIGGFYPGVIRWFEDVMGEQQTEKKKRGNSKKSTEFTDWKPVLVIMAWVFLFFVFVFLLGFALVSPVFIACFLIRKAGMRWKGAVTYALIAIVLIYVLMEGLIRVDLWSGAIPTVIPGILGGSIVPPL